MSDSEAELEPVQKRQRISNYVALRHVLTDNPSHSIRNNYGPITVSELRTERPQLLRRVLYLRLLRIVIVDGEQTSKVKNNFALKKKQLENNDYIFLWI